VPGDLFVCVICGQECDVLDRVLFLDYDVCVSCYDPD
jgi:hypothetical protein